MQLLAISGSLRARSATSALLHAARALAPAGTDVVVYERIGDLPHFNPDVEESGDLPPAVAELRACVGRADGLVIASPEYAHGVPGSLKNALDWLVGGVELPGKAVALWHAAGRAQYATAQLEETLRTMSARLVSEASVGVPLAGVALDPGAIADDPRRAGVVRDALAALVTAVDAGR
jgi:NAD(P)H-dependent FMN reductase